MNVLTLPARNVIIYHNLPLSIISEYHGKTENVFINQILYMNHLLQYCRVSYFFVLKSYLVTTERVILFGILTFP